MLIVLLVFCIFLGFYVDFVLCKVIFCEIEEICIIFIEVILYFWVF